MLAFNMLPQTIFCSRNMSTLIAWMRGSIMLAFFMLLEVPSGGSCKFTELTLIFDTKMDILFVYSQVCLVLGRVCTEITWKLNTIVDSSYVPLKIGVCFPNISALITKMFWFFMTRKVLF